MDKVMPFFREMGTGNGIVCLHANASSSNQWRNLMEMLSPNFHLLAPDSYGSGKSPNWPESRTITLRDEVDFLEPVFANAGQAFTLIGHSYGGATALIAALTHEQHINALVLYEPTLFSLVNSGATLTTLTQGIGSVVDRASAALEANNPYQAAEYFIDFWMEEGAFAKMPEARKQPIIQAITQLPGWGNALFNEPTPPENFSGISVPVLLMLGKKSPQSSLSVANKLATLVPGIQVIEFEDLGHMGPITHPDIVNKAIAHFLKTIE